MIPVRVIWWMWPILVAYVVAPVAGGTLVGLGVRHRKPWSALFAGPHPAPRAWDHLFSQPADGWVRMQLKSGTWLGGAYADANGRRSYAAGYPDAQDLFLAAAVRVNPDTGEFVADDDGRIELLEGGILVRWEEVEDLELINA